MTKVRFIFCDDLCNFSMLIFIMSFPFFETVLLSIALLKFLLLQFLETIETPSSEYPVDTIIRFELLLRHLVQRINIDIYCTPLLLAE
jgi:hypothetical protein